MTTTWAVPSSYGSSSVAYPVRNQHAYDKKSQDSEESPIPEENMQSNEHSANAFEDFWNGLFHLKQGEHSEVSGEDPLNEENLDDEDSDLEEERRRHHHHHYFHGGYPPGYSGRPVVPPSWAYGMAPAYPFSPTAPMPYCGGFGGFGGFPMGQGYGQGYCGAPSSLGMFPSYMGGYGGYSGGGLPIGACSPMMGTNMISPCGLPPGLPYDPNPIYQQIYALG